MPSRDLILRILGDASSATKALDQVESRSHKMRKAATLAAGAVGGALVIGLKKSVSAAMDAQRVQAGTESALKALGTTYEAHAKKIDGVIASTSNLAAIDDEELQGSFTNLVRVTGNVNEALKDTKLAADLSRGAHISLEKATKAIANAENGRVAGLQKYVGSISKVTDAQDRAKQELDAYKATHKKLTDAEKIHFDTLKDLAKQEDLNATSRKALQQTTEKFTGASEAYGKTAAGAQERFQVATENLEESIGKGLLPILASFTNKLTVLLEWLDKHQTMAKVLIGVLAGLAGAVIAVEAAVRVYTAAQVVLNAVLTANPIGLIVIALAALAAGLIIAYKKSETFRDIVDGAMDDARAAVHKVVVVFDNVSDAIGDTLTFARRHWPEIATILSGPFAPIVALATDGFGIRSKMIDAIGDVQRAVGNRIDDIVGFFKALPGRLENAAGGAFSALGNALAAAIKAPINAVIGAFNSLRVPGFHLHINLPKPVPDIDFGFGGYDLPNLPTLQRGGIVERTGLAVVHEGERFDGGRGFGTTININVNGSLVGTSREDLGRELARIISPYTDRQIFVGNGG